MPVCTVNELTDQEFDQISALVKSHCGINLHDGKKQLVKSRLSKRLRQLNLSTFQAYIRFLERDNGGDELVAMLDLISTNLTSFFRESAHFDYLAEVVMPRIIAKQPPAQKRLRIWSAGCSSGEEPYTIAIVANECIPGLDAWDARILATDLSTRVLERARDGIYSAKQMASVPSGLLARYFNCVETRPERRYQSNALLKRLIYFARVNLMEPWSMRGPFDVVFCRNVMIYFDKPTQAKLIGRFWELLAPGGVLFLGHSESLAGVQHRFEYVQPTVYLKT